MKRYLFKVLSQRFGVSQFATHVRANFLCLPIISTPATHYTLLHLKLLNEKIRSPKPKAHRIHVWYMYIYVPEIRWFCMINVGKSTIHGSYGKVGDKVVRTQSSDVDACWRKRPFQTCQGIPGHKGIPWVAVGNGKLLELNKSVNDM